MASDATWQQRHRVPEEFSDAQRRFVQMVAEGDFVAPTLQPVITSAAGHTAHWMVANDAFRVGPPGDSKRAIVSHRTTQAIADLLGLYNTTPKLDDAIAVQAPIFIDFVDAVVGTQDNKGRPFKSTSQMVLHSDRLDELTGGETTELVGGGFKTWPTSGRLLNPSALKPYGKRSGINYGYHSKKLAAVAPPTPGPRPSMTEPSVTVLQQPGAAHDVDHVDVSQKARYIGPEVLVTGPLFPAGKWLPVPFVSTHPILFGLMHHDLPQPPRHPWLPVCATIEEGGSCPGIPAPPGPGGSPPSTLAGYDWRRVLPFVALAVVTGAYIWSS